MPFGEKYSGWQVCVLGGDKGYKVKYGPLPEGTPEGKGLYLINISKSSPNTNISWLKDPV